MNLVGQDSQSGTERHSRSQFERAKEGGGLVGTVPGHTGSCRKPETVEVTATIPEENPFMV